MEYKSVEDLKKHRVFYNFLEISKIPRQTFFEKEISDFILNWAKNLDLEEIKLFIPFYNLKSCCKLTKITNLQQFFLFIIHINF